MTGEPKMHEQGIQQTHIFQKLHATKMHIQILGRGRQKSMEMVVAPSYEAGPFDGWLTGLFVDRL